MRRTTLNAIQRGAIWLVLGLAAIVLGGMLGQVLDRWQGRPEPAPAVAPATTPDPAAVLPAAIDATHWLNTASLTRHNRRCRYFGKTKQGRPCRPDEGTACKLCGG